MQVVVVVKALSSVSGSVVQRMTGVVVGAQEDRRILFGLVFAPSSVTHHPRFPGKMVTPLVKHTIIKKRMKKFVRHQGAEFHRIRRVTWRRPKGIDSRVCTSLSSRRSCLFALACMLGHIIASEGVSCVASGVTGYTGTVYGLMHGMRRGG